MKRARSRNRTPPILVSKNPERTAPCSLAPPAFSTLKGWPKRAALYTPPTKPEWSTQKATGHGEEGRTRPGGRRLRSNLARAQLSLTPERLVDPTLRPRCWVRRNRAARGFWTGRKQTDLEEGEGASAELGVGKEDLAHTPQSSCLALPTVATVPVPAQRCRAGVDTEGPSTSGARSHKAVGSAAPRLRGFAAPRPQPRSTLPEPAVWIPRVPTRRTQPVPLAEELLEQRRGHAGHSQTRVASLGAC